MTHSVLYKYVSPERIEVLLNKRLRFTQACALNDPFEFSPGAPVRGKRSRSENLTGSDTYRNEYAPRDSRLSIPS